MVEIDTLRCLREKIANVDNAILKLIAKRMELSCQIGQYKLKNQLPIKDSSIEQQVLTNAKIKAKRYGIKCEMVEMIFRTLINHSIEKQDDLDL